MSTYESLPIAHDFSRHETSTGETGLLTFIKRVLVPSDDTLTRPPSPPRAVHGSARPSHSRELSIASQTSGHPATSAPYSSTDVVPKQQPGDGRVQSPQRVASTSKAKDHSNAPSVMRRSATKSSIAPAIKSSKLSSSTAPTVRVLQTTSVHVDLSGKAYTQDGSVALQRTKSISSDISDVQGSPTYGYIPGFSLPNDLVDDDARSISSMATSVSSRNILDNVRRLQREGQGVASEFWLADDKAKYCYNCHSVFTMWRRKHHCRVCGQIFCAQCAQNMRPGAPYGYGAKVVRVCDLCAAVYNRARFEDDGQKHRDEVAKATLARSPSTLDRFPSLGGLSTSQGKSTLTISAPLEAQEGVKQSRFSASALFPRTEYLHYTSPLALEDSTPPESPAFGSEREESPELSRRGSLGLTLGDSRDKIVSTSEEEPSLPPLPSKAPFRRGLTDDEAAVAAHVDRTEEQALGAYITVELAGNPGLGVTGVTTPDTDERDALVLRKVTTADSGDGRTRAETPAPASPRPYRSGRARTDSQAAELLYDSLASMSPLAFQRVHSFRDFGRRDSLLRSMHPSESMQSPAELPPASLQYAKELLQQQLAAERVCDAAEWELHLMPILLKLSRHPTPVGRPGDMSIRSLLRIKRVSGGRPRLSEYVEGVVFTKNVLHKDMSRLIASPRIMLISFALEYSRVEGQFMSLEPLIQQEREFLRNLVHRIMSHRPHILLCEKSVARVAMEDLHEKGVVVAQNIKANVLAALARSTQAEIVTSMERLAVSPRLGRCGAFRIQTFQHRLIPGQRKTLLRFEGGLRDAGATIILRGGDVILLSKIKRIMSFLASTIYGMRLECAYLLEAHGILPTRAPAIEVDTGWPASMYSREDAPEKLKELDTAIDGFTDALRPFTTTLLSTSCLIVYPPPYPLSRLLDDSVRLRTLRVKREDEEAARILREERGEAAEEQLGTLSRSSTMSSISMTSGDTSKPSLIFERDRSPRSSIGGGGGHLGSLTRTFSDQSLNSIAAAAFVHAPAQLAVPTTVGQIAEAEEGRAQHARLYDVYEKGTPNGQVLLQPDQRQHLVVQCSRVFPSQNRVCEEPELRKVVFYGANDLPLGQYIEDLLASIARKCGGKGCQEMNYLHLAAFVHGSRRIEFHLERGDASELQVADRLSIASYCPACDRRTKTLPMGDLAWRYSFGKFLELGFYADTVVTDADGSSCSHNLRDFQRYFLLKQFSVRCQITTISLCDVSMPALRLKGKVDTHLRLRDEELRYMSRASAAFWTSVTRRINSYLSVLPPDKLENAKETLMDLLKRSEADKKGFEKIVHDARNAPDWPSAEILNRVRASLSASTEAWDTRFRLFNDSVALGKESRASIRRVFSDSSAPTSPDQAALPHLQLPPPQEHEELASAETVPVDSVRHEMETLVLPLTTAALARLDANDQTAPLRVSKTAPSSLRRDADAVSEEEGSDSTLHAHPQYTRTANHTGFSEQETDPEVYERRPRKLKLSGTVEALVKHFDSPPSSKDGSGSPDQPLQSLPPRSPILSKGSQSSALVNRNVAGRPGLRRGKSESARARTHPPKDSEMVVLSDGGRDSRRRKKARAAATLPSSPVSRIPLRRETLGVPEDLRPLTSRSSSTNTVKVMAVSPVSSPRNSRPVSPVKTRYANASHTSKIAGPSAKIAQGLPIGQTTTESNESTSPLKGKGRALSTLGPARQPVRPLLPRKSSGPPPSSRAVGKVMSAVKQYERLSRDTYSQRRQSSRPRRARTMGISKPVLEVFSTLKEALKEDSDEDNADDSGADDEYEAEEAAAVNANLSKEETDENVAKESAANAATNVDSSLLAAQAFLSPPIDTTPMLITPLPSLPSSPMPYTMDAPRFSRDYPSGSEMSSSEAGQRSIWKGLSLSSVQSGFSSLVASAVDELYPLEYPFFSSEHLFENNPVVIREDEPSSIIAHTLRSRDYTEKLKLRTESRKAVGVDALLGHDSDWTNIGPSEHDGTDAEDVQRRLEGEHLGFHFSHEGVRFDCRVFYADRFDSLRRNAHCEEAFVESLTRCVRWETTGGKSGSTFLKTRDDRFIIKELSPSERDAFVKFADQYFRHLSRAFFKDVPTILAKIFGMFRISFKGAGRSARLDVLVMENVFYERKITKIYDLKGSMRNRKAPSSGQMQQVLLDENLVEEAAMKPIYMRDQSKVLLSMALHNDTHFLAEQNVMDYSLVAGFDQTRQELVVGIIDFVRTYTWDKKLEHWIKNTNKREPTIVTPIQYKWRFRQAMSQYFLLVPDAWSDVTASARPIAPNETTVKVGSARGDKDRSREREILMALPRAALPASCRAANLAP